MKENVIKIRGAKVHNLKNVSLDIPRNKLVVITGLSGSGKSSLAFDTLYAEGQRRYVESLSAYARQFLGIMQKPNVDRIEGISPAISIDQRKSAHNPRSTVGTITEIYDYLRLLYARTGIPHCPECGKPISKQSIDQMAEQVLKLPKDSGISVLGPMIRSKKGEHSGALEEIKRAGFARIRIDGIIYPIEEAASKSLDKNKKHNLEVIVDRLILDQNFERSRLVDSLEIALKIGKGLAIVSRNGKDLLFSEHFGCEECGVSLPDLEPKLFSFNSPYGACPECTGLGEKLEVSPELVMPNPNLTIAEGAVIPWMKASHKVGRQGYYWQRLAEVAEKNGFSLHEPVKNLPKTAIDLILYGDGRGFEGVIPNLGRRYRETDSEWTRQEIERYMVIKKCERCQGKRLKPEILAIKVKNYSIYEIVSLPIVKTKEFFKSFFNSGPSLRQEDIKIAQPIIKEILNRLNFLSDVGLDYLTLDRRASTLSGGESQRIRLATQIGSKLTGVLYILDEPSIGLHAKDQGKLIATLKKLRDLGNTVILVEHDDQTIKSADWIIDVGPGAGKHGGRIIFEGTPKQLLTADTLTGKYLSGKLSLQPNLKTEPADKFLLIEGAKEHNLKNIDVRIPLGRLVSVTGVSGSGKSSLVKDILAKALLKEFYRAKEEPGEHKGISGLENLNKVVLIDQSPIGRTPRSNPATYTGAFSYIRQLFSQTKEAKIRGYDPGRFSFNVKGGRCETCEGQGQIKVEMYFLPDVYVECSECGGKRYNKEALEIIYKGKNIAETLEMTVEEAGEFFKTVPGLYQKVKTLNEVGLSYVEVGQPAPSLSGGEAQRVKLAAELSRREAGMTLYILDEPTTGLHADDVAKLAKVLRELVNKGNSVLVVEHNIDFIKSSDWIIDLGPEGGERGGYIVAQGTVRDIVKNRKSYTGKYLRS